MDGRMYVDHHITPSYSLINNHNLRPNRTKTYGKAAILLFHSCVRSFHVQVQKYGSLKNLFFCALWATLIGKKKNLTLSWNRCSRFNWKSIINKRTFFGFAALHWTFKGQQPSSITAKRWRRRWIVDLEFLECFSAFVWPLVGKHWLLTVYTKTPQGTS